MNARGGGLLLIGALGCGAPSERATGVSVSPATAKEVSSAPPGESVATCTVSGGFGDFAGDVQLFDSTGAPLARVQVRGATGRVELLNRERSARAFLDRGRVHLEGRVDVNAHPWELAERSRLIDDHLFAPSGIAVRVLGVGPTGVRVEARGPFERPKTIDVPCAGIAFDAASDAPSPPKHPDRAAPKRPRLALRIFDRPKGRVLVAEPVTAPFVVLEEREGFAHVQMGTLGASCEQGLVADGWVVIDDITPAPEPPDRDDVCGDVLDMSDRCSNATIARASELFIAGVEGDHPRRLGRIDANARVEAVSAPKGRLTAIRVSELEVRPPARQALFVESAALTKTCAFLRADEDDGCPCDP